MGVKWLGKIKIHEIAKELGVNSKEVIAKANELGIQVTSHLSAVEEDVANQIKEVFGKQESKSENSSKKAETPKKEDNTKKQPSHY